MLTRSTAFAEIEELLSRLNFTSIVEVKGQQDSCFQEKMKKKHNNKNCRGLLSPTPSKTNKNKKSCDGVVSLHRSRKIG